MALSAEDQKVLASMRQRELNVKKRLRASNKVIYQLRWLRRVMIAVPTVVGAVVAAGIFLLDERGHHHPWTELWRPVLLVAVAGAVIGALLGQALLNSRFGQRRLRVLEWHLDHRHGGDLHAGRRWMQFFYKDEDISSYVQQILYVIDSEHRFDSVDAALQFVKENHRRNVLAQAHGLRQFNAVAERTNAIVLSSVNAHGQPSNRVMRFVKTDQPGVWYVTSAPDTPKVPELNAGKVALITVPTEDGATITSNRVRVRRTGNTMTDIADLYRVQVPRYMDGMTEEDQRLEVVYELTILSAKVDSWIYHDLVFLREPDEPDISPPTLRAALDKLRDEGLASARRRARAGWRRRTVASGR